MNPTYTAPISCKGIVVEDGKVWLRQNERETWELPGGKLEQGEQPETAVAREMSEELGIEVTVGAPVLNYVHAIPTSRDEKDGVLVAIYYCTFIKRTGELETEGEAGSAEFKAFAKDQIDDLPMPVFYKKAIRAALKGKRL
jgi:8-oxo-dGTP pyrophosphatase MutT (NUDIX family)